MKRFIVFVMSLFSAFCSINAQEGLSLNSMWREYDAAEASDKPQKQISILEKIKSEALKAKLPADFYRAGEQYCRVLSSTNWKLRDSAETAFAHEIDECGMPVAQFHYKRTHGERNLLEFVKKNEKILSSGANRFFWEDDYYFRFQKIRQMTDFLKDRIENDYEFALWYLACPDDGKEAREILSAIISYPKSAILEFTGIEGNPELTAFKEKYSNKAAGLMAEELLFVSRFDSLSNSRASSEDFKKLRKDCKEFEQKRHSFSGDENKLALCCGRVADLCSTLDSEDISASIKNGILTLNLQNLGNAAVSISKSGEKGKTWSVSLENKLKSYYVRDTLTCKLPDIDDGEYTVTISSGSKEKTELNWSRYSISLAQRWDADGLSIYAADYLSGEPLKKADIYCTVNSKKTLNPVKDFGFSGFTRLPSSLCQQISDARQYELYCKYVDEAGHLRRSQTAYHYPEKSFAEDSGRSDLFGMILPSCSAFNPGQSLHFKAILYKGNPLHSFETLEEGEGAKVSIMDPDGKEIFIHEGTTDGFGGTSGTFRFPENCKGGLYRIVLRHGRDLITSSMVRVDEFVLPSYELKFNKLEGFHFRGDTIQLGGTLKSYSGHSVSSAHLSYEVSGAFEEKGDIEVGNDGQFSFNIKIKDDLSVYLSFASVKVKLIDDSGETMEFATSFNISNSIDLSAALENAADGEACGIEEKEYRRWLILPEDKARISLRMNNRAEIGKTIVEYRILGCDGKEVRTWQTISTLSFEEDFSSCPDGLYRLEARAKAFAGNGHEYQGKTELALVKSSAKESAFNLPIENFFRVLPGKSIGLQIGTGNGKFWACAELFGMGGKLLKSQMLTLDNQTKIINWEYVPGYSDSVSLYVIYFKNGRQYTYSHTYSRSELESLELPFSIERFTDKALPSSEVKLAFKTDAEVQCTASVFDKSTETVMPNNWGTVSLRKGSGPYINYDCVPGTNGNNMEYGRFYLNSANAGKLGRSMPMMAKAPMDMLQTDSEVFMAEQTEEAVDISDISVRENFETALCYEPELVSDKDGNVDLSFKTSDKLSSYIVQIFAHDRKMRNTSMRKEMLVTIPLKVSVLEPRFLYEGDHYVMKASVSSIYDKDISGSLVLDGYGSFKCTVPAGSSITKSFDIDVNAADSLNFLLAFKSDLYSDAIRFSVPVLQAKQIVTEAHSMIVHPSDDIESVKKELLSRFVNGSGHGAEYSEKSILAMINEALPELSEPESDNVISLSSALYSSLLSSKLGKAQKISDDTLVKKILDCVCSDGGFAWYSGMNSSPVVTAMLMERIAAMKKHGILPDALQAVCADAVKYLDQEIFGQKKRPMWCGWISMEQYMSVRSKFSEIPLSVTPDAAEKKNAKNYLVPKKERGLNGLILSKARRLETLKNLSSSNGGKELAKAWGVGAFTSRRLDKSMDADLASLLEYAAIHKSGGIYYPNAVMPYRGLMESELYAHSFLCNLLSASSDERCREVSDGIRLWIMIQKESQQWESDPAYIDAIASVLDGSDYVLGTKVAAMTKRFLTQLREVKTSGNGMKIECEYLSGGKVLSEGDSVKQGDKIEARYKIFNEENRSFVRIIVPHPACFSAANQLSGPYGWWMKPIFVDGFYSLVPQANREVKSSCTIFSFDSYPEASTTITEYFYVTQTGTFQAGAPTVECLYSPHYRANGTAVCGMISK